MVNIVHYKCTGCGMCAGDCVSGCVKLEDGKARYGGKCILCGHCVAICPAGAVSIPEYEMSDVEEYDKGSFALDIDNLLNAIKFRRSVRFYKERQVEREKLEKIIQAGRYTATGVNSQACRFIVVQNDLGKLKKMVWSGIDAALENPGAKASDAISPEMLATVKNLSDMRKTGTDYLFRNAPAVLYVAAESTVDAALAAQSMELAAVSQDLGVLYNGFLVWGTAMNPAACEWLGAGDKPIAVCMLAGYPEKSYKRTAPRRKADARWL